MPSPPCKPPGDVYGYGDVNGDGSVNTLDATMVSDYVTGTRTLTPAQLIRADVNGDGKVNTLDVTLITDYVAGAITTFPVCAPSSAKGEIVYPNYPTTAMVGASITVECRVKNTGGATGTFKLALYKGTARVTQTSTWNQGAGTTTGIKRLSTTVPSTGTNVSYVLKCIRVT